MSRKLAGKLKGSPARKNSRSRSSTPFSAAVWTHLWTVGSGAAVGVAEEELESLDHWAPVGLEDPVDCFYELGQGFDFAREGPVEDEPAVEDPRALEPARDDAVLDGLL